MSKEAHGTRSTTNESDKFYKVLLSLKSVGSEILTKSFINDKILNEYHGYEFLPKKITSSTSLLSMWVPWALKTTDNTKLREKLKALNEIYSKFYTNKKTLDVSFNRDIRNVIREKNGFKSPEHDLSLQLAAITKTEKTKMIKDAEEKVFEKNANQDTFESSQIYDIIRTNIKDPDPFKRMIALFIASGSRPIELFSKAMYRAIDDRWLEQKGVAKKKRGNSLDFSIIKPIIYINTHEF
ncbi:MAG: hypothetical protein H7339_11295, partial [Arcicella sp.]|nr:hypothetical protein [Arcicella sp.]